MGLGHHVAHHLGRGSGVHEIVHDEPAFAIALNVLEHTQVILILPVVTGDAHRLYEMLV